MPYSTEADLIIAAGGRDFLVGLADNDGDGSPDTDVIDDAIRRADSWLDMHIQRRHATPLTTVPAVVRTMSAEEAVYLLKRDKRQLSDADREEHQERREVMQDIAAGNLALGVDPNPGKSTAVAGVSASREGDDDVQGRDDYVGLW